MTEQPTARAHAFDREYWNQHWHDMGAVPGGMDGLPPNPYLVREIDGLSPGTALDAGCGTGAEAIWLAGRGWRVTAADIAADALARAAARAAASDADVTWLEVDLTVWQPLEPFDLVMTHYAHPAMPHLAFYDRIGEWVAPGGTLLIVGHLHSASVEDGQGHHGPGGHDGHPGHHDPRPPAEASVTLDDIVAGLDGDTWQVVTTQEQERTVTVPDGRAVSLRDVVVRAERRR